MNPHCTSASKPITAGGRHTHTAFTNTASSSYLSVSRFHKHKYPEKGHIWGPLFPFSRTFPNSCVVRFPSVKTNPAAIPRSFVPHWTFFYFFFLIRSVSLAIPSSDGEADADGVTSGVYKVSSPRFLSLSFLYKSFRQLQGIVPLRRLLLRRIKKKKKTGFLLSLTEEHRMKSECFVKRWYESLFFFFAVCKLRDQQERRM